MKAKTFFQRVVEWLVWRRRCAWCRCWLGGNPLGFKVSDGICFHCHKDQLRLAHLARQAGAKQPDEVPF